MARILRNASATNDSLANNKAHADAAACALALRPRDAVHTSIPKNACTTLRYSIALANGLIDETTDPRWAHMNLPALRASLGELVRAKYTFVVLRDPFLRLASCFLDKFVSLKPESALFEQMTGYAKSQTDFTFRYFVSQLPAHLRANDHWRPQIDFLVYKTYDDMFHFEDFPAMATTLQEKIGLRLHDTRAMTRHSRASFRIIEHSDGVADRSALELLTLKASGAAPDLRSFYDRSLVDEVAALYGEDIDLYRMLPGARIAF